MSNDLLQVLDKRILVRTTSEEFAEKYRSLMRSFPMVQAGDASPDVVLSVVIKPQPQARNLRPIHFVYRNDAQIGRSPNLSFLFRLLEWQTNLFLGEQSEQFFLLHSGAVTKNGVGILLPAQSESGKTSMTLALARNGYSYMSDEFAAIDTETGYLTAYPKPFSVKDRSVFPDLEGCEEIWFGPEGMGSSREEAVWYAHPSDVSDTPVGRPATVRYVLFPKYTPDQEPRLKPLTRGEAVRRLIENSVNFQSFGADGLSILADLTSNVECFDLTTNDLDATTALIDGLIA